MVGEALLYYEDVYDEEGNPDIDGQVIEELQKMAEIVANNHFRYIEDKYDKEDIISEGIAKGLEMIESCKFDPDYGSSLRNYIYTSMRNEMRNHIYRQNREYPVEEFYGDQKKSPEIILEEYDVSFQYFKDIIDHYKKRYGDYSSLVIDELEEMGFNIVNCPNCESRKENYDENILERLVVFAVWRIREFYL